MIYVLLPLLVLLSIISIQLLHIFYGIGFILANRGSKNSHYMKSGVYLRDLKKPKVSIIIPAKNEDIDVLKRSLESSAEVDWDAEALEIILASDDPRERWEDIEKLIYEISSKYKVKILSSFRENPIGGRNGAINEAIKKSSGDLILILDADSKIERDFLLRTVPRILSNNCDAVVGRWVGYSYYTKSRIGNALIAATDFGVATLLDGREYWDLYIVPLGSGTLFKRDVFYKIGFIDHDIIQDDYWIGVKMFSNGLKTCYESRALVNVMVPSTYTAFRIQQSRWAYGSLQAVLRGARLVASSRDKLIRKIEILIYALQYTPTVLVILAIIIYSIIYLVAAPITDPLISILPIFIIWVVTSTIYIIIYHYVIRRRRAGANLLESIKWLGTSAALTTSVSLHIAYSQLKALLATRRYFYRVTPKGSTERLYARSSSVLPELIIAVILLIAFIKSLLAIHIFSAILIGSIMSSFIYTLYVYYESLKKIFF